MIELTVCLWLRAFAGMLAVVPNIYAITLPKEVYPALRVSRLDSDFDETFDGLTGEETAILQLDYWAKSPEEITAIKTQLISFFNTLTTTQISVLSVANLRERPSFESKQSVFKQTLELTLSHKP